MAEPVLSTEVREKEAGEQYKWGGVMRFTAGWVIGFFACFRISGQSKSCVGDDRN